jgi:hypothetical protein
MSSGIFTPPKLNTVIRCGTTGKVAMEPPCSFDFPASSNLYHVGLVPLSSSMELMCTLIQILMNDILQRVSATLENFPFLPE